MHDTNYIIENAEFITGYKIPEEHAKYIIIAMGQTTLETRKKLFQEDHQGSDRDPGKPKDYQGSDRDPDKTMSAATNLSYFQWSGDNVTREKEAEDLDNSRFISGIAGTFSNGKNSDKNETAMKNMKNQLEEIKGHNLNTLKDHENTHFQNPPLIYISLLTPGDGSEKVLHDSIKNNYKDKSNNHGIKFLYAPTSYKRYLSPKAIIANIRAFRDLKKTAQEQINSLRQASNYLKTCTNGYYEEADKKLQKPNWRIQDKDLADMISAFEKTKDTSHTFHQQILFAIAAKRILWRNNRARQAISLLLWPFSFIVPTNFSFSALTENRSLTIMLKKFFKLMLAVALFITANLFLSAPWSIVLYVIAGLLTVNALFKKEQIINENLNLAACISSMNIATSGGCKTARDRATIYAITIARMAKKLQEGKFTDNDLTSEYKDVLEANVSGMNNLGQLAASKHTMTTTMISNNYIKIFYGLLMIGIGIATSLILLSQGDFSITSAATIVSLSFAFIMLTCTIKLMFKTKSDTFQEQANLLNKYAKPKKNPKEIEKDLLQEINEKINCKHLGNGMHTINLENRKDINVFKFALHNGINILYIKERNAILIQKEPNGNYLSQEEYCSEMTDEDLEAKPIIKKAVPAADLGAKPITMTAADLKAKPTSKEVEAKTSDDIISKESGSGSDDGNDPHPQN